MTGILLIDYRYGDFVESINFLLIRGTKINVEPGNMKEGTLLSSIANNTTAKQIHLKERLIQNSGNFSLFVSYSECNSALLKTAQSKLNAFILLFTIKRVCP